MRPVRPVGRPPKPAAERLIGVSIRMSPEQREKLRRAGGSDAVRAWLDSLSGSDAMTGEIDTTYQTMQRDLFAGGLAAKIGANAFAVWSAIKYHADFESGHAWPSIRRLAEMTGIGKTSVMRAVATLEAEHMLRKAATGWLQSVERGQRALPHVHRL